MTQIRARENSFKFGAQHVDASGVNSAHSHFYWVKIVHLHLNAVNFLRVEKYWDFRCAAPHAIDKLKPICLGQEKVVFVPHKA